MNGSPKGFFESSRGSRQGDSLSPYLFILAADLLGRLMARAESIGLLEDFASSNGGPSISFIQFVDDSLLLLRVDLEGMRNLRCILFILEAVSGLEVNLRKSILSPVGNVPNVAESATILGCDLVQLPITYLGLPFGVKSSLKSIWNRVIERMGSKLSS